MDGLMAYVDMNEANLETICFNGSKLSGIKYATYCYQLGVQLKFWGVEVEHIPCSCTGLSQPFDVGVSKPLKDQVHHVWREWLVNKGL